jgi:hypothetical protein
MPDMASAAGMMKNPKMMEMAMNMMKENPEMLQNMMGKDHPMSEILKNTSPE